MSEGFFEKLKDERVEKRLLRDLDELDIDLDKYSKTDQDEIRKYYDEVLDYDSLVASIGDKLIYPRVDPEKYYSAKIKAALVLNHINLDKIPEKDIEDIANELVEKVNIEEETNCEKIKSIIEKNNVDFKDFKTMYCKL